MELSIIKSLLNQLFIFSTIVIFYASLDEEDAKGKAHKYLIYAFVLQSLIIVGAYVSSSVEAFVRSFQDERTQTLGSETYSGFRALSLSAGQFFWTAGAYTMIIVIAFYEFFLKRSVTLLSIGAFLLIIVGSFFTGRTIFLGIAFALILFLSKIQIKNIVAGLLAMVLLLFMLYLLVPDSFYQSSLAKWLLEFYYNYEESGSLSTRSTDALFYEMYFVPDLKTILIGDGMWTVPNGDRMSYYMSTDSGYMRVLLYYGFLGVIAYFAFAKFTNYHFKEVIKKESIYAMPFLHLLFAIQLLLNVKGQSLGYMTSTQAILFLYFIPYIFKKKQSLISENG
ncbi:hypothetical protein [Nonlabens sp.]|uniref:hypothetical protein n=1 Tax=Nonlabens sp. TaxID=1888209 RepID=UPI003F4AE0C6